MDNTKPDWHLLYELNMQQKKLDLEIMAAEKQLESVKKRLDGLTHDLYIYLSVLIMPIILFIILNTFTMIPSKSILFLLLVIAKYLILCIYIIMLPVNLYNLINAIMLLNLNKENDLAVDLPLLEGIRKGFEPIRPEKTYRSEHDKLLLVLTRYYLNQEKLEQLYKQINSNPSIITLEELKDELNNIPYYEDIKPANIFDSTMAKKAKKDTAIIMCVILISIIISLLIAVLI